MITDFVLSLDGVSPFRPPGWVKDSPFRGTEAYFNRRKALNQDRVFLKAGAGAQGGDIAPVRDAIIANMRQQAQGKFEKAGVLCIFGSSNGAAVALAVAAVLQNELTINYICLADLPMFAGGRNPPIPGVGDVKTLDPVLIRRATSLVTSRTVSAEGDRPQVTLSSDINAKIKENYFQHNGNKIEAHTLRSGWFWTSTMKNNEVHGKILNLGWSNIEKTDLSGADIGIFERNSNAFHRKLDDFVEGEIFEKRWPAELAKI